MPPILCRICKEKYASSSDMLCSDCYMKSLGKVIKTEKRTDGTITMVKTTTDKGMTMLDADCKQHDTIPCEHLEFDGVIDYSKKWEKLK